MKLLFFNDFSLGVIKGDNKHYLSTVHDEVDIALTIDAWDDALSAMAG